MVDPAYCQLMARYNRWMDERLYATVAAMPDDERMRDRGAFFGSIHRTLAHITWADRLWLARFLGRAADVPGGYGAGLYPDFVSLTAAREATDTEILSWAGQVTQAWLESTLSYTRAADGRAVHVPAWVAATHYFQHQAHHRGQATTLLRQAGADMGVTDLPWMPGVARFG